MHRGLVRLAPDGARDESFSVLWYLFQRSVFARACNREAVIIFRALGHRYARPIGIN